MSEKIIQDIHNYIKFIEHCGYIFSMSFIKNHFSPFTNELMEYDFHPHHICNYLKQNPGTRNRCVQNKFALEKHELKEPYYSCCYAGVEEFLIPLTYNNTLLCCMHISGYRGKLKESEKKMKEISALCDKRFEELYYAIPENVPSMDEVLSFIKPIQYMLIELYKSCNAENEKNENQSGSDNLYIKALRYIHDNYQHPINCAQIAEKLKYSQSYIRYIFKREGNVSVQAKINDIRLNNAKRLLVTTNMSITEIAFSTGFADSNYFSVIFKKSEKVSPKEYRKNKKFN